MVDDLLADTDYLLYANLRRLVPAAGQCAHGPRAHPRTAVETDTAALDAAPAERASLFSVTEALDGLGRAYRDHSPPGRLPGAMGP